jgi:hypothetical protein
VPDRPIRLGDVIDDYCPRCRLLLNHDVASLTGAEVAKVTCRTCHNSHDYRHAQVPPKRTTKKAVETRKLFDQVLSGMPGAAPLAAAAPIPAARKKRDLWADLERLKKK